MISIRDWCGLLVGTMTHRLHPLTPDRFPFRWRLCPRVSARFVTFVGLVPWHCTLVAKSWFNELIDHLAFTNRA